MMLESSKQMQDTCVSESIEATESNSISLAVSSIINYDSLIKGEPITTDTSADQGHHGDGQTDHGADIVVFNDTILCRNKLHEVIGQIVPPADPSQQEGSVTSSDMPVLLTLSDAVAADTLRDTELAPHGSDLSTVDNRTVTYEQFDSGECIVGSCTNLPISNPGGVVLPTQTSLTPSQSSHTTKEQNLYETRSYTTQSQYKRPPATRVYREGTAYEGGFHAENFEVGMDIGLLVKEIHKNCIRNLFVEDFDRTRLFGDAELLFIAAALKGNSSVVSVQIRGCPAVTDVSLIPLYQSLYHHNSVRAIDMSNCTNGTEKSGVVLRDLVCKNTNIIFVEHQNCRITDDDAFLIEEATQLNMFVYGGLDSVLDGGKWRNHNPSAAYLVELLSSENAARREEEEYQRTADILRGVNPLMVDPETGTVALHVLENIRRIHGPSEKDLISSHLLTDAGVNSRNSTRGSTERDMSNMDGDDRSVLGSVAFTAGPAVSECGVSTIATTILPDGTTARLPKKKLKKKRQSDLLKQCSQNDQFHLVCNDYMQGRCRYGSRCKYYHPEKTTAIDNYINSCRYEQELMDDDNIEKITVPTTTSNTNCGISANLKDRSQNISATNKCVSFAYNNTSNVPQPKLRGRKKANYTLNKYSMASVSIGQLDENQNPCVDVSPGMDASSRDDDSVNSDDMIYWPVIVVVVLCCVVTAVTVAVNV
eukprot:Tbor_TRINITY_DN5840_c0_g1::TRINITY_DN5840_c0_g1_i6::g.5966::m.5966